MHVLTVFFYFLTSKQIIIITNDGKVSLFLKKENKIDEIKIKQ